MGAIRLYSNDNVAVAGCDMKKGEKITIDGKEIVLLDDIIKAHKIALKDFQEGDTIIKYDNVIGAASEDIKTGALVHDHNVAATSKTGKDYKYEFNETAIFPGKPVDTFMGYKRADGRVGIRNHVVIISNVFCANGPTHDILKAAQEKYPKNDHFDGFISFDQQYGCSIVGEDYDRFARIYSNLMRNPNFGGVLLISLGCEVMRPDAWQEKYGDYDHNRIKTIVIQEVHDEVEEAMKLIDEIMKEVDKDRRTECGLDKLHVAMNCGGSDGLSGVTANRMLGTFCDSVVKQGGTMNMTEVPEMMGAEHLLMNRSKDEKVFNDQVKMIHAFEDYFKFYGQTLEDNPTQGNHAGGLSTLADKSLGCTQKGGHCAVMEVVPYGEMATEHGFLLVDGPGNDLVGITAQVAAGAVLTIFTTGRGTPCGFASPTFRIASNSEIATLKPHWFDFDAGRLLKTESDEEAAALDKELYDKILRVVNGEEQTWTEKHGYYQAGILKISATT